MWRAVTARRTDTHTHRCRASQYLLRLLNGGEGNKNVKCNKHTCSVSHYLFAGNELAVTNNRVHWLNSDAIWLQRLTSEELIISHLLAVMLTGGGSKGVDSIRDSLTCW